MQAVDLREALLNTKAKADALAIVAWVNNEERHFASLMKLFLEEEYRVVQKAAWIMSIIAEKRPQLLAPHLEKMIVKMQETGIPVAVKRNVVRILQNIELPETLHGPVMNVCFDLLADVRETVAVRAFSMTVLGNLAKHYPEINNELRAIIEDGLEHNPTPGFRSRAMKILKGL